MNIKILGGGCPNCKKLEENVRKALSDLEMEAEIEKVTDFQEIVSFGIVKTPALVVDGAVKIYGKVATVKEIKKVL